MDWAARRVLSIPGPWHDDVDPALISVLVSAWRDHRDDLHPDLLEFGAPILNPGFLALGMAARGFELDANHVVSRLRWLAGVSLDALFMKTYPKRKQRLMRISSLIYTATGRIIAENGTAFDTYYVNEPIQRFIAGTHPVFPEWKCPDDAVWCFAHTSVKETSYPREIEAWLRRQDALHS